MNTDKEYLVSVLVPAYNHERYILECLEGLANQTYKDFQLIITDDHSSDSTPKILKDNQEKYGYELILNDVNVGISASLTNMAKNYAKGKYIMLCASDDIYMPDRVEKQVDYMENHPQCAMCYARTIKIDQFSNIVGKDTFQGYKSGNIFEDVYTRRYNIGICVAMKHSVLEELGYYQKGVLAEDYYMNCRIAEKYEIGFVDDYLLKYRTTPMEVKKIAGKRDPWALVSSHRQTVELFSYRPEYKEALRNWELSSGVIIARFKKYKLRALYYLLKNITARDKHAKRLQRSLMRNFITRWWDCK